MVADAFRVRRHTLTTFGRRFLVRKYPILVSIVALLAVTDDARAGDRQDIVSVHKALFAALNANDIDVVQWFYAPNFTPYHPNGNLLTSFNLERVRKWPETGSINIGEPNISGSTYLEMLRFLLLRSPNCQFSRWRVRDPDAAFNHGYD